MGGRALGSFTFDPAAGMLRRGAVAVPIKPGQEWTSFELLVSKLGEVVPYEQLAERLGAGFQPHNAHTIIHRLRGELGADSELQIVSIRGVGYRLDLAGPPAGPLIAELTSATATAGDADTDTNAERRIYLGNYRGLIHELAASYELHLEKLRNIADTTRLWFERELLANGLWVHIDAHVQQVDEFRLAYKQTYRQWYDALLAAPRAAATAEPQPFASVANLVMVHGLCIDRADRDRVLDLACSLRRPRTTPRTHVGDNSVQVDLEIEAPLQLAGGRAREPDEVRSFRLQLSTFDDRKAHLLRRRERLPRARWSPGDKFDERSLLAYANTELAASAQFHSPVGEPTRDARGQPAVHSRLWLSHILDSARFIGLHTLGDLDQIMRRGLPAALRYRETQLGSKTFQSGDVTDLLSKALMFGSEDFFATYPSRPETALFQRDLAAIYTGTP